MRAKSVVDEMVRKGIERNTHTERALKFNPRKQAREHTKMLQTLLAKDEEKAAFA